jgi:hypothetical protein
VTLGTVTVGVEGGSLAVGVENQVGGTLTRSGTTNTATVTAISDSGNAYGIRNYGALTGLTANVTAEGALDSYGLYNAGGTVSVANVATTTCISATSASGQGYGLYSVGGSVGTPEKPLYMGAFAGSTFGIYCTDGSIAVSGNELFFKGSNAANAVYENTAAAGKTPTASP